MALPAIGAKAPEPILIPDVRRLDQMPCWPAWLASRVESMKDEYQRSPDGKGRTVPTLPAHLMLTPAERVEVERHVAELDELCAQTPLAGQEWEGLALIIITKLMLALPSTQQNDEGAQASGEAYQAAVDDLPYWAAAAAQRRWNRGDGGLNDHGLPYNYTWRPAPADLRRIALFETWRVKQRGETLRRLLVAEPRVEFSDEHCARMRARLATVIPRLSRIV
jgi:hypothetical protein